MIYHGITHPKMGYKINTVPYNLRSAAIGTEFTYSHEYVDVANCRVVALSKSAAGQRKYLICIVDGYYLWAIHPHYHTGMDLAVRDSDGRWYAANDMQELEGALGRAVTEADIPALVESRTLLPEDELPYEAYSHHGYTGQATTAPI